VAGRDHHLKEGAFLAVGPGVEHWLSERPKREYHIYFAGVDLRHVLKREPECRESWKGADHLLIVEAGGLAEPFGDLMQEVTGARFGRSRGVQLALDRLVLMATRLLRPEGGGRNDLDHPATNRARYLVERQPERPWQLAELARAAGVSPAHLRRCFRRDIGLSPRRFVLKMRIARACRSLVETDVSITTLAHELGFSSSQHFAQVFRSHLGEAARDYRTRQRTGRG
jgi:transcriptional regulator GlxA family with amidase domain